MQRQREYIITVEDPKVWDEVWDRITQGGLGDNFIPTRAVEVINERPFNDFSAHFSLTDDEAALMRQDPRFKYVELQADLRPGVEKRFNGQRPGKYDKSDTIDNTMKNWTLLRGTNRTNPFASSLSVNGNYNFNLDGTGVDIVVVDTGVDPLHPEFAVNADGTGGSRVVDFDWSSLGVPGTPSSSSIGGYMGDGDGHGSNCASLAAGNTCGWASGAAIYSIRIFTGTDIRTGVTLGAISSDIAYDIVRAFHLKKIADGNKRPTVCTNSWGYRSTYGNMVNTVYRGTTYNITTANSAYGQVNYYFPYSGVNYLNISATNCHNAGVVMVGAAGNYYHKIDVQGGLDYDNTWRYQVQTGQGPYTEDIYYHRGSSPTMADGFITVGAVDNTTVEQKATFSETGPRVDVYSPGAMLMGAYANKSYRTVAVVDPRNSAHYLNKISGTSQATPNVAGLAALLLQLRPTLTPTQVKQFIVENATTGALQVSGAEGYTNQRSLQGGQNRLIYNPFNNPQRGSITS